MGEKLWFGTGNKAYDRENVRYYDVAEFPWAIEIENNWPSLKNEISKFIAGEDADFISNEKVYKGLKNTKGWHSISSRFWEVSTNNSFEKNCPKIYTALSHIPGIVSVSFSKLEPQTKIGKHHGETNAIMRCHLGVEIPAGMPECGMNVSSETKGWEEGKWLLFNDAQYHYAWNNTDKRRILLIIDVIRPEFMRLKKMICARILAEHALGKRENKYKFLQKLPPSLKRTLIHIGTAINYLFSR